MLEIKIEKVVYNGFGLSRYNGKVIFTDFVIPDEIVCVEIIKEKKSHSFAKLLKVLSPSEKRVNPECKYFTICGGCQWQHIQYPYQLVCKKEILTESIKGIGKLEKIPEVEIIPSPHFNYRNRAKFHISDGKLGFFKKNSHNLITIDSCKILTEEINSFIKDFNYHKLFKSYKDNKIEVFSTSSGEVLHSNKKFIYDAFAGNKFRISINSFFQGNKFLIEKMLDIVKTHSIGYNRFLDLYCGVGLFTIPLGKIISKGIGIESSNASYKDSLKNLKLNNLENIKFFRKKVENSEKLIKSFKPDLVVVDPPRAGIHRKIVECLNNLESIETIIYISCNPLTFSRDLKIFASKFYLQKLYLLDMFPHTFHIETVSVLQKR